MALLKIQKRIDIKNYACSLIYMVTDSIFMSENYIHKKYGGDKPIEDDSVEGYAITINSGLYIVVLDFRYITNNLIGHELYHVTQRIGGDRDIEDEESMAWLNGYLHEEFYKFINTPKYRAFAEKIIKKYEDDKQEKQVGG
jgi:hypothetical protein